MADNEKLRPKGVSTNVEALAAALDDAVNGRETISFVRVVLNPVAEAVAAEGADRG